MKEKVEYHLVIHEPNKEGSEILSWISDDPFPVISVGEILKFSVEGLNVKVSQIEHRIYTAPHRMIMTFIYTENF